MPRLCKHCGMESETDRACSWCGKPLEAETAPPPAAAPAPGKAAPPAAGPPAPARGRGKHAGAARALLAADRQRRETPVWRYYVIGAGVLLVLVFGAFFFVYWRALRPPAEPTEWKDVTSETKLLSLQVPANWRFSTSGSTGQYEWVRVISGRCRVDIEGSMTKGTMGDIAGAAARLSAGLREGGGPQPLEERAEGRLHASFGELAVKQDPNYKDADDMQACQFAGLAAACSHYTTRKPAGIFSVEIKGLRITAPGGGDLAYDVRLTAPAKAWDEFEPIANQIVGSVTRGTS